MKDGERKFWMGLISCVTVLFVTLTVRECFAPVAGLTAGEQAELDSVKKAIGNEKAARAAADSIAAAALERARADSVRAAESDRRGRTLTVSAARSNARADSALAVLDTVTTARDTIPLLLSAVGHLQATIATQGEALAAKDTTIAAQGGVISNLNLALLAVTTSRDSARTVLDRVPAQFTVLEETLAAAQRKAKRAKLYGAAGFGVALTLCFLAGCGR